LVVGRGLLEVGSCLLVKAITDFDTLQRLASDMQDCSHHL
jgi:hypothetical protein